MENGEGRYQTALKRTLSGHFPSLFLFCFVWCLIRTNYCHRVLMRLFNVNVVKDLIMQTVGFKFVFKDVLHSIGDSYG